MKLRFTEIIKTIPVARPLFFFLTGMLLSGNSRMAWPSVFPVFILLFIFLFQSLFIRDVRAGKSLKGMILMSGFLAVGFFHNRDSMEINLPEKYKKVFIGELSTFPVEKKNSWQLTVRIIDDSIPGKDIQFPVHATIYLSKTGFSPEGLHPGSYMFFRSQLERVRNAGNPDEFDYAGFLMRKDIYYSGFVRDGEWAVSDYSTSSLRYTALKIRNYVEGRIRNASTENLAGSCNILVAIGLGNKAELSREKKEEFSSAGAIHIMAVSGLHVGMIWIFINFLTSFAERTRAGRMLRFLLICLTIWCYALITGLSPSVGRSALMFTIIGIGTVISRRAISINIVLLAAFIQVLADEKVLSDLGFQFSYLAVISILLFQGPVSKLFPAKRKIPSYFTGLISVSISAQILTFPLTIFYFHRFPVFFILTNVMVIPVVTIIMMLFIASFAFLVLPGIYDFILGIILRLTALMDNIVVWISELPGAVAENLTITSQQLILLFLCAFFILIFRYYKKPVWLYLTMISLTASSVTGSLSRHGSEVPEFIVFNSGRNPILGIYDPPLNIILFREGITPDEIDFYTESYLVKRYRYPPILNSFSEFSTKGDSTNLVGLPGEGNFIYHFQNKRIVVISDYNGIEAWSSISTVKADFLVLASPADYLPDLSTLKLDPDLVITNFIKPGRNNLFWKPIGDEGLFNVAESGAFRTIFPVRD